MNRRVHAAGAVDTGFTGYVKGIAHSSVEAKHLDERKLTITGDRNQARIFDCDMIGFRWKESLKIRGRDEPMYNQPTILLHNVLNKADSESYFDHVNSPSQCHQLSRWLDYATVPLLAAMGSLPNSAHIRDMDVTRGILQAVLKSKKVAVELKESRASHVAQSCSHLLRGDVLRNLATSFPSLAVWFLNELSLDRVSESKVCGTNRSARKKDGFFPLTLHLPAGTEFYVASSDEWESEGLWAGEFKRNQGTWRQWAGNHFKERGANASEMVPHVVGVANLLEDENMELLRVLSMSPLLLEAFSTDVVKALVEHHWTGFNCAVHSTIGLVFHLLFFIAFYWFAFGATQIRQRFVCRSEPCQETYRSRSIYPRSPMWTMTAAIYVLVYTLYLFWTETRHLKAHERFFQKLQDERHQSYDEGDQGKTAHRVQKRHDNCAWRYLWRPAWYSWRFVVGMKSRFLSRTSGGSIWATANLGVIVFTGAALLPFFLGKLVHGQPSPVHSMSVVLAIIFMTARTLGFMRLWPQLSPLVHMFEATLFGSMNLLLLTGIFMAGLSAVFHIELSFHSAYQSFPSSFFSTFSMALGETDLTGEGQMLETRSSALLFAVCNIVLTLVILNLLIAQIGDTFDRVTELMPQLRWKGKADLVIEESAMSHTRAAWVATFSPFLRVLCFCFNCSSRFVPAAISKPARKFSRKFTAPNKNEKPLNTQWLHVLKPRRGECVNSRQWLGRMRELRKAVKDEMKEVLEKSATSQAENAMLRELLEKSATSQSEVLREMKEMRSTMSSMSCTCSSKGEEEEHARKQRAQVAAKDQGQRQGPI